MELGAGLLDMVVSHVGGRKELHRRVSAAGTVERRLDPGAAPHRARDLVEGLELVSLGGATEASIWSICYRIGSVGGGLDQHSLRPTAAQPTHACAERCDGALSDMGTGAAFHRRRRAGARLLA